MRTEQLEYLLAIKKYHSMSIAGHHLNVSQQAISLGIKQLENELQVDLIHRTNKGSFLTPLGENIASFAADFFLQLTFFFGVLFFRFYQVAGHIVARPDFLQNRLRFLTLVANHGAAARKVAALGRIDGAGHVPGKDLPLFLRLLAGVRNRHRGEQSPGIGMQRMVVQLV